MDETQNITATDVNTQTDTQTAGDSSSASQQTSDTQTQDTSTDASQDKGSTNVSETLADGDSPNAKVPIRVVQETRLELQAAKRELAEMRSWRQQIEQNQATQQQAQLPPEVRQAREQLKGLLKELGPELGYVSKEEIQQQNAFNEVKSTHDQLASKYDGKKSLNGVLMPKYDEQAVTDYAVNVLGMRSAKGLEAAYKLLNEAEITNARLEAAISKTRGVKSERSNGTGSANTGVSNDDLKKAAQGGNKDAITLLIKRRLAKS